MIGYVFYDGAKKHPNILFVISAGNDGFDIDSNPVFPHPST